MRRFLSRKLLVAVGAAVVAFVGSYWPEQEDLVNRIVVLAIGYLVAQGAVDVTTEAKGVRDEHK
jgi:hypothetical protein